MLGFAGVDLAETNRPDGPRGRAVADSFDRDCAGRRFEGRWVGPVTTGAP
jgi:hypothetical protein